MKAGVYVRISEDREGRELGVTRQREDCAALAERLGATVFDTYVDNDKGASARSRKRRKEYERLLADARAGKIGMVIAYTSGRLTRRIREHEDLIELAEQHGTRFEYVRSPSFDLNTSAGKRIARILAVNDAGEAEDISERSQREALQRAQQRRPHGGPRPYGFAPGERELVDEEAERIADWYATILAGGSIRGIRKRLDREGVQTPAGKPWNDSSIRIILMNERNAGLRALKGEMFPSPGPAIVSEETWRATVALLNDPGRRTLARKKGRRWLGAGLFLCDRCSDEDATQPVRTSYDGTRGNSYRIYLCKACSRSWKADPIDEWVTELLEERLSRPDARDLLLDPRDKPDVDKLRDEAFGARKRLTQLAEEFADGILTSEQLRTATTRLRARVSELEEQMEAAGQSGALAALAMADEPAVEWRELTEDDTDRRQAIVRGLVEIRLGTPIRGRAAWDADKFITVNWRARG